MAGYSGTPLVQKLGIKDGHRVAVVNGPDGFWDLLVGLPGNITVLERPRAPMDCVLCFATTAGDVSRQFPKLAATLAPAGMLWIGWPKKKSPLAVDPACNENEIRRIGLDAGLVDVKVCAIDDDWSGLKFVRRVKDR
jgi:hypothetical protein